MPPIWPRPDRELVELQLAHALGEIRSAYRRDKGIKRRAELLEAYAAWLSREKAVLRQAQDEVVELKTQA